jgi:hypothetical protein
MLRHCTTIVYESLIEITNNTGIVNTNVYNNKKKTTPYRYLFTAEFIYKASTRYDHLHLTNLEG